MLDVNKAGIKARFNSKREERKCNLSSIGALNGM
jgi:hypothetical protein